jgi:hypothetical protein
MAYKNGLIITGSTAKIRFPQTKAIPPHLGYFEQAVHRQIYDAQTLEGGQALAHSQQKFLVGHHGT